MLRGKCFFHGVDEINDCCQDILEALSKKENSDLKLISLENRLQKQAADIKIKILFGRVVAEIELAFFPNAFEY